MAANNQSLFLTNNGVPAPQYYNQMQDTYEVLAGENGAMYMFQLGLNVRDFFSGTASITKPYGSKMRGFAISNDADIVSDNSHDLTFTINGLTIIVKPKESIDAMFDPFTSVTVTTTVPFRAIVRG